MRVNIPHRDVTEFLTAGGLPSHTTTNWPGDWILTKPDPALEVRRLIESATSKGLAPYLHDYYFGDKISLNLVKGLTTTDGRSLPNAVKLTRLIAEGIKTTGAPSVIVAIETEFNKGGALDDGGLAFDAYFERAANVLKAAGAKVVLSPGLWGSYKNDPASFLAKLPRSVAATDYIGTQMLRALTDPGHLNDEEAYYAAGPDMLLASCQKLKGITGKPVIVTDVAFSSYGQNGEDLQREAWERLVALKPEFEKVAAHVFPRAMRDITMSPNNFFGAAESFWGVVDKVAGIQKPAYVPFMQFSKPSTPPAPNPAEELARLKQELQAATGMLEEVKARCDAADARAGVLGDRLQRIRLIGEEAP